MRSYSEGGRRRPSCREADNRCQRSPVPPPPPGPPKPEPDDGLRLEPQPAGDEEAPLDAEGLVKEGRQGEAVTALELAGGEDAVASFIEGRPWDRRSEALLEKANARFPTNPKILSDRAQYCLLQNRVEEGLDVLGRLLEAEPRSTSDRATRARVLRTLGRLDEAERVLGNTPPDLRTDPEIVQERVELLLDHGRPRDAVAELEASKGEAAVANFIARRSWTITRRRFSPRGSRGFRTTATFWRRALTTTWRRSGITTPSRPAPGRHPGGGTGADPAEPGGRRRVRRVPGGARP